MPAKRPSRKAPGTLSTQVMDLLGRRIVAGEFPAGSSLPVEPALCRSLGVSRTTLREAVKKLHGKGLVAIGPKRGTRVRAPSEWMQLDPDVLGWRMRGRLDGDLLRQLYEVRAAVEPEACRLAAINADADARRAIADAFAAMAAVHRDAPRVVEADVAFHMSILDATRNVFLGSLGAAIRGTLSFAFGLGVPIKPFSASELRGHRRVMDDILARRPDAAARNMRRLLDESHRTLAAALGLSQRAAPKPRKTTTHRRKPQ